MKMITKAVSIAAVALALGGVAHAAQEQRGWGGPDANATVTRADAQAKAEAMFTKSDANGDGKLDSADMAAKMGQRFDAMDTDRNGALSRDEFLTGHQHMRGADGHEGHKMGKREGRRGERAGRGGMMRMADANGDGALSKQEAVGGALKHFDMADANKDGKLTPEERKAAHAKMRGRMKGMRGGMDRGETPPPAN
ncbi:MAG: EF-hand domain-containing protein [Novosphingobium sp.]|uniref:EF-hand domain-containing protein n=1 Tax=Novosphingobium sp. TaxID=1874826 RepID=UPI0032B75982